MLRQQPALAGHVCRHARFSDFLRSPAAALRYLRGLEPERAGHNPAGGWSVIAMLALHGVQIWLFAFTYLALGAIPDLESALYFSTISYSTVGYNDTHVLPEWRLLGAFESVLGIFMLGWSTAFFFRMIGRIDPH